MPTSTPWGPSQGSVSRGRGIIFYDTASHGGFHVSAVLNRTIPGRLRLESGWYEEDCDWSRVALAFPTRFSNKELEDAEVTLRNYYPDAYEAHFNRTIQPGESYKRDKEQFAVEHVNDFVTYSACGDWHERVPTRMVGVYARRASDRAERTFLIPVAEYSTGREHGFVVDVSRHEPWGGE